MDERYKIAVGFWGISHSDFFTMTPRQWCLIADAKAVERKAIKEVSANGGKKKTSKKKVDRWKKMMADFDAKQTQKVA